jgi:hypothetical protein
MPALANSRHEAFAQAFARGLSIAAAHAEAGYKPNRGNAHTLLKQNKLESLIAEAEAARIKAMSERGGAAAAVSALTAKAKLAGMWRDKVDQHNTGSVQYERIERVIVEHTSNDAASSDAKAERENSCEEPSSKPQFWSA